MLINRRSKFYIEKEKSYDISLKSLDKDEFISKIKTDFIINRKCKQIYFNIQNEDIIIRNMDSVKSKRQKDIISLIKYEINQYMPIDLNNYHIKYKIIKTNPNKESIQIILLPKSITKICIEISNKLKLNKPCLNIDFDILNKVINKSLINNLYDEKILVIGNKLNNVIINKIYNKQIIESYVLEKTEETLSTIKNLCKNNRVYFYGIKDNYIKNIEVNNLEINKKLNIYPIEENNINISQYIMTLGMIVK